MIVDLDDPLRDVKKVLETIHHALKMMVVIMRDCSWRGDAKARFFHGAK